MKRFEDYRFDFECICKVILINGAKETKMEKSKEKLFALANKVYWHYGFIKDSDVDDKDRRLNDIGNLLMNIRGMIRDIDRFIDTDSFTDYFAIVKMCVNVVE